MMTFRVKRSLVYLIPALMCVACGTHKKLTELRKGESPAVQLNLAKQESFVPQIKNDAPITRDTLKIVEEDGSEIIIMKAVKDEETGEMVASDVIDAATVTARFRNVAERMGKVDLAFQVIVPESMMDSKWQLRFYPDMFVLEDSVRLDPVIITGEGYRKAQKRGYQQYERFLAKIVEDTTKFINVRQLEIFLKRNIPEVYAFKTDTTFVTDEEFNSVYGVSHREAVEHYTNQIAKSRNERRIANRGKMYEKYVKSPIVTEGIRLDTVIVNAKGDFVYNYVQTINTRPKLRKVDIVLSGDIYELDKKIYQVPAASPLTFYISSISAFADNTERYMTTVIERSVSANASCKIEFEEGKSDVKPEMADNYIEIQKIKSTLASLLDNEDFDLDSIVVSATASPEGQYMANKSLAQRRSESVSQYFNTYMADYLDSLEQARGIVLNLDETYVSEKKPKAPIRFTPRCVPENWDDLYDMVRADKDMDEFEKTSFFEICEEADLDAREKKMQRMPYYSHLKQTVYPRLRCVKFNFYLHRRGMTKDTVHTTVIDSTYMRGVHALRDMDYQAAIELLGPYKDFNAAIAYVGLDRNINAMSILQTLEKTDQVNYLLAILYSRAGDEQSAVECYLKSCKQNPMYVHRGNLDPEISVLIKTYGLNQEEEY